PTPFLRQLLVVLLRDRVVQRAEVVRRTLRQHVPHPRRQLPPRRPRRVQRRPQRPIPTRRVRRLPRVLPLLLVVLLRLLLLLRPVLVLLLLLLRRPLLLLLLLLLLLQAADELVQPPQDALLQPLGRQARVVRVLDAFGGVPHPRHRLPERVPDLRPA